jgi:protein TonB
MKPIQPVLRPFFRTFFSTVCVAVAAFVTGCATPPPPVQSSPEIKPPPLPAVTSSPAPIKAPVEDAAVVQAPAPEPETASARSHAANPKDYRRDAAQHLYARNPNRIFKGKLPPLLYAIGVLQVEVDSRGMVTSTHWMRPPQHAPEVMADIERTVRLAAPYPAPVRLGRVTYTDTWLWHKSGLFQLDTLTEGQL